MNIENVHGGEKPDRKMIERKRRIQMKGLCFKLTSLIPSHHFHPSREMLSQQDQLHQAASYIKQLSGKVDELKRRKKQELMNPNNPSTVNSVMMGLRLPVVELRDMGSSLEVVLISGLQKNFMFCEVISILQEEGAEVINASISTVGDKVFHTFHAQVMLSRVGVDTSRVNQRLKELVC